MTVTRLETKKKEEIFKKKKRERNKFYQRKDYD